MNDIKIETSPEGITLSSPSPSPEWSITGEGGRTDTVFIANDEIPAVLKAIQQRANEIREIESL